MKSLAIAFVTAFLVSLGAVGAAADSRRDRVYLEVEPLNFANEGVSLLVHVPVTQRLHLGSNAFTQVIPSFFRDVAFDVEGPDIAIRQFGINFGPRYFLSGEAPSRGWVVSAPIGYETLRMEPDAGDTISYGMLYTAPRIGFLWRPTDSLDGLFVLAEAGVVIPLFTSGTRSVGESSVSIRPIIPFPNLGLGYSF